MTALLLTRKIDFNNMILLYNVRKYNYRSQKCFNQKAAEFNIHLMLELMLTI